MKDYRKTQQENKKMLLSMYPKLNEGSGIYVYTREENDYKFAYVGQAKHILTRLAQHLVGYQWIDLSLKKHGLYSKENENGWKISFVNHPIEKLDEKEQEYIKRAISNGYILRNLTLGGQGEGKQILGTKPVKGYRDGLKQGYKNAQREVQQLFKVSLEYSIKGETNKNKEKALKKFETFIKKY